MLIWLEFLVCTAIIVYSGIKLSRYGDVIAEKTGLGGAWIGVVLMASVTSLPELITGISSVTFAGAPDIAVGDVLGSCAFNILIIALLDTFYSKSPISARAHHGHIIAAGFGILLLGIASISLYLGERLVFSIGWIGFYSILFSVIYFVAMRIIYVYEKKKIASFIKETAEEEMYRDITLAHALSKFVFNAFFVIAAAVFLPSIGVNIAEISGLGETFVGSIFISISTSLPEVVISASALKMGAVDMAVGNLFGSNIFNILILAIDDVFFGAGPILSYVNTDHIITSLCAILMTVIAVIGLTFRAERKTMFIAWDSIGIFIVYVLNVMLLYTLR